MTDESETPSVEEPSNWERFSAIMYRETLIQQLSMLKSVHARIGFYVDDCPDTKMHVWQAIQSLYRHINEIESRYQLTKGLSEWKMN